MIHDRETTVTDLLERYSRLLDLYGRMDEISLSLYTTLDNGASSADMGERMRESSALAETISTVAGEVASLKERLVLQHRFTPADRDRVRQAELSLAGVVTRIVERDEKSRDLVRTRGVRIPRR